MRKGRQRIFCPYCGGVISPKDTTCPHCGSDLSSLKSQFGEAITPKTGFREALRRIPRALYKPDATFTEISQSPDLKGPLLIILMLIIIASIQAIATSELTAPIDNTIILLTSTSLIQSWLPNISVITQQILIISITNSALSVTLPLLIILPIVEIVILWPIFAVIYWALSKALKGEGSFRNTLTILAYAGTPQIIGSAISVIYIFMIQPQIQTLSTILLFPLSTSIEGYMIQLILGEILIETAISTPLTLILQIIVPNATILWTGILIGYGLIHIHKISKNKALITGLIIPIILVAISLYQMTILLPLP
ncbi:MAG: YIP1 family protein [Candidatus Freyarchaeum deiterrae]